jgi:nitrate reductase molybdenum cofactor assembly chaperone NarJ/NarW
MSGGQHGMRALAALLDYPTAELLTHADEIDAAAAGLPVEASALAPLLAQVRAGDLYALQENYIDTFDRGRRTSLNLFEHVHGDSRDRGQAMVDLLTMYRTAGIDLACDQLPDYLPAFLDYLSLLDEASARKQLAEIAHILQSIRAALARRASIYTGAFDVLLALAGESASLDPSALEDDSTPAAIDAAWIDAPVDFMGAPCPSASQSATHLPQEQAIHVHRRAA